MLNIGSRYLLNLSFCLFLSISSFSFCCCFNIGKLHTLGFIHTPSKRSFHESHTVALVLAQMFNRGYAHYTLVLFLHILTVVLIGVTDAELRLWHMTVCWRYNTVMVLGKSDSRVAGTKWIVQMDSTRKQTYSLNTCKEGDLYQWVIHIWFFFSLIFFIIFIGALSSSGWEPQGSMVLRKHVVQKIELGFSHMPGVYPHFLPDLCPVFLLTK